MQVSNSPKGTPPVLVPVIILCIWLVLWLLSYTGDLPHKVSLPIVLATIGWFIVWFVRLVIRSND